MKTHFKKPLLALALIAGLGLLLAGRVTAQTFTTLHRFTALVYDNSNSHYTNNEGAHPYAGLITNSSGTTLFGTTYDGGSSAYGTVFAVNTDGTGFTILHSFTSTSGPSPFTNSDGAFPKAGLILSSNILYGTTSYAGSSGYGTVFAVNTDGTGFTNLHSFTSSPGNIVDPRAWLVLSGNTLYGTATGGGSSGNGTVFKVNTDGTGFTNVYNFTASSGPYFTNSDGASPEAGLILSSNTLYGTAAGGGRSGSGTVFALNTDSTGFTNLYSFTATPSPYYTNRDGASPQAGLILSGNTLYGTAYVGGSSTLGTVFKINTDGTHFTSLHSFVDYGHDGNPQAGLILSGNTLYGTTVGNGTYSGTVFKVNTDGTGFTNIHNFNLLNHEGAKPQAGLIFLGTTLYGTTVTGLKNPGTVFSLSFASQLTLVPSGVPPSGIILSWPTNVAGFDYTGYTLQSTTNLAPPAVWTTNSPAPVIVNGQYTVTNPITGDQMFYRLSQ